MERRSNESTALVHRGKIVAVEAGNLVAQPDKHVKCEICEREFINSQGLGTQRLSCEKTHGAPSISKQTNNLLGEPSLSSASGSSEPDANKFVVHDVKVFISNLIDKVVKA